MKCAASHSLHYDMIIIFLLKSKFRTKSFNFFAKSLGNSFLLFFFGFCEADNHESLIIFIFSVLSLRLQLLYFYLKYFFYNETFSSLFQHMQPIIMVSVRFLFIIFKVLVSKSFVAIINKKCFQIFFHRPTKLFSVILFQFNFSTHFYIIYFSFKI